MEKERSLFQSRDEVFQGGHEGAGWFLVHLAPRPGAEDEEIENRTQVPTGEGKRVDENGRLACTKRGKRDDEGNTGEESRSSDGQGRYWERWGVVRLAGLCFG